MNELLSHPDQRSSIPGGSVAHQAQVTQQHWEAAGVSEGQGRDEGTLWALELGASAPSLAPELGCQARAGLANLRGAWRGSLAGRRLPRVPVHTWRSTNRAGLQGGDTAIMYEADSTFLVSFSERGLFSQQESWRFPGLGFLVYDLLPR